MRSDASVVSLTSDQHFSLHAVMTTHGQSMQLSRKAALKRLVQR